MGWWGKNRSKEVLDICHCLAQLYKAKLLPLEDYMLFPEFHSPLLDEGHFTSKPMVLLLGQYSTGKTTFLRYLVERDYPGMRIGPEPTTDGFMILEYNKVQSLIPGNALVVDPTRPYAGLSKFGVKFMDKFQASGVNCDLLKHVTLIDSPGILSGSKQLARGYDFVRVLEWFAGRVDRIVILFDAHKLDISDELTSCLNVLKNHQEKIKIVLNKADEVNSQQLIRVYGALLWSLARIFDSPEVMRVYAGSFWSNNLKNEDHRKLFEMEKNDLFMDFQTLPRTYTMRLLNDLVKRARVALVHAYVLQAVRKEVSTFTGATTKKKVIENLSEIYKATSESLKISLGDFPPLEVMKNKLNSRDIGKLPKFRKELADAVLTMLSKDLPVLMNRINQEEMTEDYNKSSLGGILDGSDTTPFREDFDIGVNKGQADNRWIVDDEKERWQREFEALGPNDKGKLDGGKAKAHFVKTKLPNSTLGRLWQLSDIDKDGFLDYEEFALMMYLIYNVALKEHPVPDKLPKHLIPPSKRVLFLKTM